MDNTGRLELRGQMIFVRVKMLGSLKEASEEGELELTFSKEVDVSTVILRLIEKQGEKLDEMLLDPVLRSPLPNALILVNGIEINNLDDLKTPVGDGDSLIFLPVTHGG